MERCKIKSFKHYIPDFDKVFDEVKDDDRYQDLYDEYYDTYEHIEYRDIVTNDDDAFIKAEERAKEHAYRDIIEKAKEKYDLIVSYLEKMCSFGKMMIYRVMDINDLDTFVDQIKKYGKTMFKGKLTGVGTYWAFDPDSAEAHSSSGGKYKIMLVGTVQCDDINFENTVYKYMIFEGEDEINIIEDKQIFLNKIDVLKDRIYKKIEKTIPIDRFVFA